VLPPVGPPGQISPTYDLFGNGKSKLYAGWGRYLAKVPNDLSARPPATGTGISSYAQTEVTLNKNFADNWGLVTSYRWSKLKGNFQGFAEGGSVASDPSIVRLFDFPQSADPSGAGNVEGARNWGPIGLGGPALAAPPGQATPTYQQDFLGGIEFEVARSVALGVRYVHRTIPRVLEDVGPLSLSDYLDETQPPRSFIIIDPDLATLSNRLVPPANAPFRYVSPFQLPPDAQAAIGQAQQSDGLLIKVIHDFYSKMKLPDVPPEKLPQRIETSQVM
jgi:hypothetical protein